MYKKYKHRIYEIVDVAGPGDTTSKVFDIFIIALIVLNVVAVMLGTVEVVSERYSNQLRLFEIVSVIIFSIEYLLRFWSTTESKKYTHPISGRLKYMFTPMAIVDLVAILPFFIPMLISFDLRFVRALRLIRLFRLFKMGRYSSSFRTLVKALQKRKEELLLTIFVSFIILIVASSMMYYVERDAQPEKFSSIPSSMWWGIITLTTIGYGDVSPVTPVGKVLGGIIALLGIGLVALPTGIIASGLVEVMQRKATQQRCPHCGKEFK